MYVYRKAKYKELSTSVYRNHRSKMKDRDDRVAASVCQREIERGITWTYNGRRTYNAPGCNRQWVVDDARDLSYLGSLNVHAHVARTVARDRSIEILYRRGVRVTFLDECS